MNLKYTVCTGPILVPTDDGVEMPYPAKEHVVHGSQFKFVNQGDVTYFTIVAGSTPVFGAPASTVLWVRYELADSVQCPVVKMAKESKSD